MWSIYVLQLAAILAIGAGAIGGLNANDDSGWAVFIAGLVFGAALYGFGKLIEDVHDLKERLAPSPPPQSPGV